MTIVVIVFGPIASGIPDEAVPDATAVPFTVMEAVGSVTVGVTVTEVVALLTVAV